MKDILITGAYGGMGRAATAMLAERGYRVFALDRSVEAEGTEEGVIPIEADITSESEVIAAVEAVRGYTDSLCAVLHFAGIYMLDSLVEMGAEAYDLIFDVNVRGAFLVNKMFLPLLGKGSRIVMTTSELAPLYPLPFTGIYAVTKAALDKYAYALRMELQLLGINVSVLRAGAVETGMLGVSTDALDRFCKSTELYRCNAERFKRIVDRVEARSIPPERIAKSIIRILGKRNPRFAYSINRNPLLVILNALPKRFQLWVIRRILGHQ
ncbi:MAG: SDR family NAD(P)-dependent oxidoreductase [Clostridia bacterium]|nr:SDR family NAD(P)-dependent oxidoreductase [Clostridia bacterium]